MAGKRGNPVEEAARRVVLNQGISNPVGNSTNTDKGKNQAGSKVVPTNPKNKIYQGVGNPSVGKSRSGSDVAKDRKPGDGAGMRHGK
jgi:hypothetical protein